MYQWGGGRSGLYRVQGEAEVGQKVLERCDETRYD